MRTLARANWWEWSVCWRWNWVREDGTPWLIPPIFVGYLLHTRCSDGAWYTTQKIMEWHLLALRNSRSSVGSRQQAHYCKLWKVFWRNKGDVMTAENRGIEQTIFFGGNDQDNTSKWHLNGDPKDKTQRWYWLKLDEMGWDTKDT